MPDDFLEDTGDFISGGELQQALTTTDPFQIFGGDASVSLVEADPFGLVLSEEERRRSSKIDPFNITGIHDGGSEPIIDVPSPSPPSPGASAEEINEFNLAMEDFQLLQQGRRKEFTDDGGFFIREIPDAELGAAVGDRAASQIIANRQTSLVGSQIQEASNRRTLAALRGEITSPLFERGAEKRAGQTLLAAQRGPGATSTPGIQNIQRQRESDAVLRESIAGGEITAGQAINFQQLQQSSNVQNQLLQNLQGGRFGAAQIGLGQGQLGLGQQDLNTQLQIANILSRSGRTAGQQQLLGTVAGAIIPSLIGLI